MGIYSNTRSGVSEGCQCGPNHARRMWPDPAAAVADAVEQRKPRESRRVVLEFYPVDGVIPVIVFNLLHCAVQPRRSNLAGSPAAVREPHQQVIKVYM